MKTIGLEAATVYAFIFTDKFRAKVPVFVMYIMLMLIAGLIATSRLLAWAWKKVAAQFNDLPQKRGE